MTPIYLKNLYWLAALAALAALAVCLLALARVRLSLHLTYPMAKTPRLSFSADDWPFCLRLAKFLSKRARLQKLHCQIKLSGRPDICALAGGTLLAGLHSLAALAGCRDTSVQLQLATPDDAQGLTGDLRVSIALPLWAMLAAALRLAVYFVKRKSIIKSTEKN